MPALQLKIQSFRVDTRSACITHIERQVCFEAQQLYVLQCRTTAREALRAWPGGMQLGGGVTADNAVQWLDAGASHVIVTSYVFRDGRIDDDRLRQLVHR